MLITDGVTTVHCDRCGEIMRMHHQEIIGWPGAYPIHRARVGRVVLSRQRFSRQRHYEEVCRSCLSLNPVEVTLPSQQTLTLGYLRRARALGAGLLSSRGLSVEARHLIQQRLSNLSCLEGGMVDPLTLLELARDTALMLACLMQTTAETTGSKRQWTTAHC